MEIQAKINLSNVFGQLVSYIKKTGYTKIDIILYNRIISIDSPQFTKSDIGKMASMLKGYITYSVSYEKDKPSKIYLYPDDPKYAYDYIISNLNTYQTFRHKTTLHLI